MAPTIRPLGSSGLHITTVGLGTWAIGGGGCAFGWGPQDDEASIATVHRAVGLGINWVDTAAVYGRGHSEEVVGRAIRRLAEPDRPLVFTKCGLLWDDDPMGASRSVVTPKTVKEGCEASLRRLGLDHIDLLQIHWPDDQGNPIEPAWTQMAALKAAGWVRAIGVSNFDADLLRRCEAIAHVDSLQPPLSLIERDAAADLLPWCRRAATGAIVYSPMQSGLLTDSFSVERFAALASEDWRRQDEQFRPPLLELNLALRDALRPVAARHAVSVSATAVAWTLAWNAVTGAIVGARSPQQVDGWIDASRLRLTSEDLDEIAAAIEETGAGTGPAHPDPAA
jgi:aryl-alcohol dehydrogenase-like predicted oxidoreductase